ncbi:xylulokinase [Agrilactobacillus fermenti]|uniref:xylulokinase n=1 Tax=Agrilactobacillus fermenti TaxID=2586909 RepID=UPI003A5BCA44
MSKENIIRQIKAGQTSLGIELGSTRIKAVLIVDDYQTIASGSFNWENELKNKIWTYSTELVWKGIQASYAEMSQEVEKEYGIQLEKIGSIGISAMMHSYMPFDSQGNLLVPFRTWRNNITEEAANYLTDLFNFNIPQRWSVAHLYQAILNQEDHVKDIDFITTLAGYVHWQLSGQKVLGIGDASGMFPIDSKTKTYDTKRLQQFGEIKSVRQYHWTLEDILPKPLMAGTQAGTLNPIGAQLLDPTGTLKAGAVMAPPEGDAGTGMVGTNSVRKRTGNISAGTSAFSMVVLDQALNKVHRDIDMVTTPDGADVAMVHTNNCSSDINSWVSLFREFAEAIGHPLSPNELYKVLFNSTKESDPSCGGLINIGYLSGENITNMPEGRPLFVRTPNSDFNLGNFIKTHLYSAFAPLKIGMDILSKEENIHTDNMVAQGGLFKTPIIGQQVLADALDTPITVMSTAGEGGPWGMAVLATFVREGQGQKLEDYLDQKVFANPESSTIAPDPRGVEGFNTFIEAYKKSLPIESTAIRSVSVLNQ